MVGRPSPPSRLPSGKLTCETVVARNVAEKSYLGPELRDSQTFLWNSTFHERLVVTLQYGIRHYACPEDEEFLSRRPSRGTRC